MGSFARIHPEIQAARRRLEEARSALCQEHRAGLPGPQTGYRLSDLTDSILVQTFQMALPEGGADLPDRVAVVAHSGLGRRDMSPYSDVDVMLLYGGPRSERLLAFSRNFLQLLSDLRFQVGFSLRSVREVTTLAAQDPVLLTSLIESRLVAGSAELFDRYWERFSKWVRRWGRLLVGRIAESRREEQARYGDTIYLLCPNVKRSRGGLRDIHLVRWLGFVVYGERDPHRLEKMGVLLPEERRRLSAAYEFLLKVRHDLHFHAQKAQDVLDRNEQVRLARLHGFVDGADLLAVEQFMRVYIEHTADVRYASSNFLAAIQRPRGVQAFLGHLFSRRVDGHYTVGPRELWANRRGVAALRGNLSEVLRLMELAALAGKRISHQTWQQIRRDAQEHQARPPAPEAIHRFLALLGCHNGLGNMLRRLHELRVLEHFIPPMRHARNLLQFNEYHKYTVDEHSIRAVEMATRFAQDAGLLGELYRAVPQKRTLHLALLLHDLGKGYGQDHSQKGAELALETCRHLGLGARETETVVRLVRQHLLMAHVALRHDLSNESVVLGFAREVGSIEFLRLLFLLTCADVQAVGPGAFTQWKFDLLAELYYRTLDHLAPDSDAGSFRQRLLHARQRLLSLVPAAVDRSWWQRQIESLPAGYLQPDAEERIVSELEQLACLPRGQALAWGRYLPDRGVVEYTVGTTDDIVPGIFHRLTGVLTSTAHSILSAQIHTLADQLVLDRFFVEDLNYQGEPPADRIAEVCRKLVDALVHPSDARPTFPQFWRGGNGAEQLRVLPEYVRWDNSTSAEHTILTVFAYDRVGLLYSITRALFELGINVHMAKIATYLDQVVDVFYVTDRQGRKIEEPRQLEHICQEVAKAIQMLDASARVAPGV